jgi:hypothetical protein
MYSETKISGFQTKKSTTVQFHRSVQSLGILKIDDYIKGTDQISLNEKRINIYLPILKPFSG